MSVHTSAKEKKVGAKTVKAFRKVAKRGDQVKIAHKTGLTPSFISYCVSGKRYNPSVIKQLSKIVERREKQLSKIAARKAK